MAGVAGTGDEAAASGVGTPPAMIMIGSGEYTTGFGAASAKSDKSAGVVAITVFDLRSKGLVGDAAIVGVNGKKFPKIREHMGRAIRDAYPASKFDIDFASFPGDDEADAKAYEKALTSYPSGSCVTIFTPDDTHFDIALAAVRAGHHVLVTKPAVMKLSHHIELAKAAREHNVLVSIEVHKRWDPMYVDARDRIRADGSMSFMTSYMSQPKRQLETFKAWAGIRSDISYYLNSHHVDFAEWCFAGIARPVRVTASAATGVADATLGRPCEDTITLLVDFEDLKSGAKGTGVFTSSWVAPPSDVHSQQRFFVMTRSGEVRVDQAHRGYSHSSDASGYASVNPLFMKYTPTDGAFSGQTGYGYRSISEFVRCASLVRSGEAKPEDFDSELATIHTTAQTTAVLEAGRRSLDADRAPVDIVYEAARDAGTPAAEMPVDLKMHAF